MVMWLGILLVAMRLQIDQVCISSFFPDIPIESLEWTPNPINLLKPEEFLLLNDTTKCPHTRILAHTSNRREQHVGRPGT